MRAPLRASAIWAAAALFAAGAQDVVAQEAGRVSGTVSVVGDYRFRGLSQTYTQPAVQVGFEYTNPRGWYGGTWGSNVSGNQFLNGGSLELDLYGGYRWSAGKAGLDVGLLHYWYPRARYNIEPGDRYNTTEAYVGARYAWLSVRYSHALSDLFGMKTGTIGGYCGINSDASAVTTDCLGSGATQGSGYLDFTAIVPIGHARALQLHAGRQRVRNYGRLSYWDYRLGVTQDWAGLAWGVAVVGTDAEDRFYRYTPTTAGSTETEYVGRAAVVLSVGRSF